jgi:hypothetical protein
MSAAIPIRPVELDRPDKRFATAQARAAMIGATLHRIEDDRGVDVFIVSKWNLTRELRDMDAVELWLDRIAGKGSR